MVTLNKVYILRGMSRHYLVAEFSNDRFVHILLHNPLSPSSIADGLRHMADDIDARKGELS